MTEAEKRLHRCCFTGHRPERLTRSEQEVKRELEVAILQAIGEGFTVFLSGVARGTDLWAAQIVLRLRDSGYPLRLICASPFEGFEKQWSQERQRQYQAVLVAADYVRYVCPGYSRSCFQLRNEWLVQHAARVIAVFNGTRSGTKNTIDYALKTGVPVKYIRG